MSIQEIEQAITQLAPNEFAQLREWMAERDSLQKSGDATPSLSVSDLKFPPSVIQPAAIQDPQERIKKFEAWVESHCDVTAIADDSRECIY